MWLAALGALALACAFLVMPTVTANAAGTATKCSGSGSATANTHGGKHEKLYPDKSNKAGFKVAGDAACESSTPGKTAVTVTGTADVVGTCLNADVSFSVTLTFNNGEVWTSTGTGKLVQQGDDIVVSIVLATATSNTGQTAVGINVTVTFKGAAVVCINQGYVSGGTADATGAGVS
ncbi:hypothetical protein GCM10022267_84970 [Lentzea roselyniae]|uniref:Uncharacterized protein n=1 Tax=Lentzea roselyniae TaxID=531940 RepID=A0ABP7CED9_9PSEU